MRDIPAGVQMQRVFACHMSTRVIMMYSVIIEKKIITLSSTAFRKETIFLG
jgi:hypothetical protein